MPAPTVLRFYTIERKFFLTFKPKTQLFHLLRARFPPNYYNANSTHCSPKPPKLTIFMFWEPRFTPNKAFWPLTEAQKVPLSGFEEFKSATSRFWEAQNVPLSGSDHLLKLKKCHLQDLRTSKSTTFRFWEPRFTQNKLFWPLTEAQNGPLSAFEGPNLPKISLSANLRSSKFQVNRPWAQIGVKP